MTTRHLSTSAAGSPAFGTWAPYHDAGRIGLAVVLFAVAAALGVAAARGWPRRRPAPAPLAPPRPERRAVTAALVVSWFLALIALGVCVGVYAAQVRRQYGHVTPPVDPITPVTFIGAGVVFIAILVTSQRRFPVTLAGAVLGAMAGPVIFELPFDLVIMARIYPPIQPDPAQYRALFFVPLFLIELVTLALLTRSPMPRPRPAFGWLTALMLALFGVWALDGFGYPSAPLPIALNIAAKLVALAAALSLFLPPTPAGDTSAVAETAPG